MSIEITERSIIYINCPAQVVTGGPEALHQLYFKMKAVGLNAVMYYTPAGTEDPVAERYKHYNVVYAEHIEDHKDHIIIVPEVRDDLLKRYTNIRKAIWWLSIDNYFKSLPIPYKLINKPLELAYKSAATSKMIGFKYNSSDQLYHFAQSRYAYNFLKAKGLRNIYMLSDYLNVSLLDKVNFSDRRDIVLYNPKKGINNTKVLMEFCPEINWTPLENMSVTQLKDVLSTSKVYIDFGNHPGKDRLPREAAINGCCIITNREGSAGNSSDVAIPEHFKFYDVKTQRQEIIDLIKDCFVNYKSRSQEFAGYRAKINSEEKVFENEIKDIFKMEHVSIQH